MSELDEYSMFKKHCDGVFDNYEILCFNDVVLVTVAETKQIRFHCKSVNNSSFKKMTLKSTDRLSRLLLSKIAA